MADFSLALNDDQLELQKWVHDFAATVVRPAAHEWDEREEFPYPIVEEAAKISFGKVGSLTSATAEPSLSRSYPRTERAPLMVRVGAPPSSGTCTRCCSPLSSIMTNTLLPSGAKRGP